MNEQLSFGSLGANPIRSRAEFPVPRSDTNIPLTEESAIELMTEMRRDMLREVDWQLQRVSSAGRGPTSAEAILALGSLATGAVLTSVLVTHSTTVMQGLLGTQTISHWDVLPFVVIVWLAVLVVNVIWARRR